MSYGSGAVARVHYTLTRKLVATIDLRFMRITAEFYVRGGIYTTVVAEHRAIGWAPPQPVTLP